MPLFSHPEFDDHVEIAFRHDRQSGLKAIIALHNLNRGPALGGCRMWAYDSDQAAATDVLRLARGMTYKSALAELPYGGGKSVIIGDPKTLKSEALFRAMGRFVQSLGGRYIIAEDVGVSVADVEIMAQETDYVAGVPAGGSGDPSPATAYGVFMGIKAAVRHRYQRKDLTELTIAIQGLGQVGYNLCEQLSAAGAKLIVSDLNQEALKRAVDNLGARVVTPQAIYSVDCDIYAPCALGATVNDDTLGQIKAGIIAGSANNQLARPDLGLALRRRGILYAPDYVINAGGVINISHEGPDYDKDRAFAQVADIGQTLGEIFRRADVRGLATSEAADQLAEERFSSSGPNTSEAA